MSEEFNAILQGSAHINLGKNGVTPGILEHIRSLMKGKKFLKIKVLKEAADEYGLDALIEELIRGLEVYIYDVRGHVIIISKRYFPDLHQPKTYFKMRAEIIGSKKEGKPEKNSKKKQENISTSPETVPSEDFIDYDDEEIQTKLEVMDLLQDGLEISEENEDEQLNDEEEKIENVEQKIIQPTKKTTGAKKSSSPIKKHHGKTMSHPKKTKKSISLKYEPPAPKISQPRLTPKSGRNSSKREVKKDG